ncbi:MAG TPA: PilZ domain-containing protein [Candidatus Acidoferrales bacterium]|nr:PilZ domain-containing protein [Candidatus Acidoferrales bacterium]
MTAKLRRVEERTAMKVTVDLSSVDVRVRSLEGVTENVSSHGARVITSIPVPTNARLNVRSMLGSLRSRARVVYCHQLAKGAFAVGLELSATVGKWMLPAFAMQNGALEPTRH